jgi:phospholipase C
MADIRDRDSAEQLAAAAPDEYLKRRDFLARTAATAGLAAGLATTLSPTTLVAEAARMQRRQQLPSPRNMPVDTIVVLMMENRSFDHYLGWMPEADGIQAGLSYVDREGKTWETRRLAPDWQGCGHPDPDHSWTGGRGQLNGGACDGFLKTGNDVFAVSYYEEKDLGFIPAAAKAFTTFDHFHCSLMAATLPNREYMHAATSYGLKSNDLPPETEYKTGFPDTTIFAALEAKGISNRYFYTDIPASALWGAPGLARSGRVEEYYARCATGTLPHVSFVDPNFAGSVGEDPGLSGDEHPHGDVRAGQAWMADVVHAFMASPQWKRGALFIVYDEWGGFFDHVAPPRVPDDRNDPDINKDYGQLGFRVPAVCVSPWVRRGHVAHTTYSFESILKMIEYRFGLAPLTKRDAYASNIARAFDWKSKPRLDVPILPDPPAVLSQPCATSGLAGDEVAHEDQTMMQMVSSGYLERLGFDFRYATPADMFRAPHTVVDAYRRSL